MSKVIVHRHAAKYLQRLPKKTKERIKNILKKLEESIRATQCEAYGWRLDWISPNPGRGNTNYLLV